MAWNVEVKKVDRDDEMKGQSELRARTTHIICHKARLIKPISRRKEGAMAVASACILTMVWQRSPVPHVPRPRDDGRLTGGSDITTSPHLQVNDQR